MGVDWLLIHTSTLPGASDAQTANLARPYPHPAPHHGRGRLGPPINARENITTQRLAANVRHLSGMSTIKADADVSISRASIRIRRRTDVNAGMWVLFDGQVYEIDDVLPGESREHTDLVCRRT